MSIPCDAKYYFIKIPSSEWTIVEPGPIKIHPSGSFVLYESPVVSEELIPGKRYVINYKDKQNLKTTESYPYLHFLPFTNAPVVLIKLIDISKLVRGSFLEESLQSQGIRFQAFSRQVAIVKGLMDDTMFAGPAGYLSNSWNYVVGSSYLIRDSEGEGTATYLGSFEWRDHATGLRKTLMAGWDRLIVPIDCANSQYYPTSSTLSSPVVPPTPPSSAV
jgi:hypothetical protein